MSNVEAKDTEFISSFRRKRLKNLFLSQALSKLRILVFGYFTTLSVHRTAWCWWQNEWGKGGGIEVEWI